MDYVCMAETDVGQTVSGPISASASGQILRSRTDVVARCGSGRNCSLRASPFQSCVALFVRAHTVFVVVVVFVHSEVCVDQEIPVCLCNALCFNSCSTVLVPDFVFVFPC